jgi:RHS repeat-associated protein
MNLSLPGQYRDAETGLHDNWHRTYDPKAGRYLQPDPLGYPDGPDPYLYAGGDPVNKVDPTGLYQVDTHYYMTFFLAVIAGMDVQAAQTIALAAQGVDDNDDTRPLNLNNINQHRRRLLTYHFVLIDSQVDPATGLIRTGINTYGNPPTSTNVNNPLSFQLDNLLQASQRAPTPCARFQFLGEYLHAFEDTFSHRDRNNRPYALSAGLGHGADASDPDYTYNHGLWQVNANRTLAMQLEVFETLRGYGNAGNSVLERGVNINDLTALLRQFNAIEENDGNTDTFQRGDKVRLLTDTLARWGYEDIEFTLADGLQYNSARAIRDRRRYLCGLRQVDYPGTILPSNCPTS